MCDPFANAEIPNPIAEADFREQQKRENAELSGMISGARQEKPCIYVWETGKHEWQCLTWRHYPDAPVFIPFCSTCGWVDVARIFTELSFKQRLKLLIKGHL